MKESVFDIFGNYEIFFLSGKNLTPPPFIWSPAGPHLLGEGVQAAFQRTLQKSPNFLKITRSVVTANFFRPLRHSPLKRIPIKIQNYSREQKISCGWYLVVARVSSVNNKLLFTEGVEVVPQKLIGWDHRSHFTEENWALFGGWIKRLAGPPSPGVGAGP